ncbi:hypothetical protein AAG570_013195 [Ranatra chinensis]|uniref:Uncharacterized protein n=1 Tax=Ranatra chinensis TaxID=642074 RepID=A0ABD0YSI6_9HEMI
MPGRDSPGSIPRVRRQDGKLNPVLFPESSSRSLFQEDSIEKRQKGKAQSPGDEAIKSALIEEFSMSGSDYLQGQYPLSNKTPRSPAASDRKHISPVPSSHGLDRDPAVHGVQVPASLAHEPLLREMRCGSRNSEDSYPQPASPPPPDQPRGESPGPRGHRRLCVAQAHRQLDLGLGKKLGRMFTIVDAYRPIIGAKIRFHHGILVDVKKHCHVDPEIKRTATSDKVVEEAPTVNIIQADFPYTNLLRQFPNITRPGDIQREVHHHIETTLNRQPR